MKTLLSMFLVLVVAAAAASATTTVTLVPIQEGEPGSASNPLQPSDKLVVAVTSDGVLIGLDCVLTITGGPGVIVDGCMAFCCCGEACVLESWPPDLCFEPWIEPDGKRVEIGGGMFGAVPSDIVGYFVLHCEGSGQVSVELSPGTAFGGSMDVNFQVPTISGQMTIHQVSGPTCWDTANECAGQSRGDCDCDGDVDLGDLYCFKVNFGRSAPWVGNACCADFNQSGAVDLADLFVLKAQFGASPYLPATGNQNCP